MSLAIEVEVTIFLFLDVLSIEGIFLRMFSLFVFNDGMSFISRQHF